MSTSNVGTDMRVSASADVFTSTRQSTSTSRGMATRPSTDALRQAGSCCSTICGDSNRPQTHHGKPTACAGCTVRTPYLGYQSPQARVKAIIQRGRHLLLSRRRGHVQRRQHHVPPRTQQLQKSMTGIDERWATMRPPCAACVQHVTLPAPPLPHSNHDSTFSVFTCDDRVARAHQTQWSFPMHTVPHTQAHSHTRATRPTRARHKHDAAARGSVRVRARCAARTASKLCRWRKHKLKKAATSALPDAVISAESGDPLILSAKQPRPRGQAAQSASS